MYHRESGFVNGGGVTWTSDAVRELRLARKESQGDFARALGVSRVTVSRWESGTEVSDLGAAALDALARVPLSPTADYLRGLTDAARAVRALLDQLERDAADAAVIGFASAADADPPPTAESPRPETGAGVRRRGLRLHTTPDESPGSDPASGP